MEFMWKRSATLADFVRFSPKEEYLLYSDAKIELHLYRCSDLSKPLLSYSTAAVYSLEFIPEVYLDRKYKLPVFSLIESLPGNEDATASLFPIQSPPEPQVISLYNQSPR